MLDHTPIYTAMTRAQSQVIIVGDPVAVRKAVEGLLRAHTRNVGLRANAFRSLVGIAGDVTAPTYAELYGKNQALLKIVVLVTNRISTLARCGSM